MFVLEMATHVKGASHPFVALDAHVDMATGELVAPAWGGFPERRFALEVDPFAEPWQLWEVYLQQSNGELVAFDMTDRERRIPALEVIRPNVDDFSEVYQQLFRIYFPYGSTRLQDPGVAVVEYAWYSEPCEETQGLCWDSDESRFDDMSVVEILEELAIMMPLNRFSLDPSREGELVRGRREGVH